MEITLPIMKGQCLNAQFVRGQENVLVKKNLCFRICQCATHLRGMEGQCLFGAQVISVHLLFCPAVRNDTGKQAHLHVPYRSTTQKRENYLKWLISESQKEK